MTASKMMKSSPSLGLPNPATLPPKPRRQGPRLKALVVVIVILTFVICKHNGEALQRTALGSWNRWISSKAIRPVDLVPLVASEGSPWTESSLKVDKSEDHLPSNFKPLGPDADERYELRESSFDLYMKSLLSSAPHLAQPAMAADLIESLVSRYGGSSDQMNSSIPDLNDRLVLNGPHKEIIWQTDKTHESWAKEHEEWNDKHKEIGWKSELLTDTEATKWVKQHFAGTDIEWAWNFMTRPILRADFLRYLLLLVHGGFYADADTSPLHPVSEWGSIEPEVIDISRTDGPDWRSKMAAKPSVVVGLEVNPVAWENWATWIARPISFVQFAFGSTAYHPIFVDVVDRIVQMAKAVDTREKWMTEDLKWRKTEEELQFAKQIQEETQRPPVLAWTGPTVFSDAIISWLVARYKVSWQRIRGYDRPVRIGDVLILPHGALNAGLLRDYTNGGFLPQAQMEHFLHGDTEDGWKQDGP